jgi:hypothetical protein
MHPNREAFLEALDSAGEIMRDPEVGKRWADESCLPGFTIAGLTGHLLRAGTRVGVYLDQPEPDDEPIPAPAYFAEILKSLDASENQRIISDGVKDAEPGWGALIERHSVLAADLRHRLEAEPPGRKVGVFAGKVMLLDDYLETRIVELLVHTDDLATSIGADSPQPPPAAAEIAIPHLVSVARMMHGDRAVLMALSRRERDEVNALRVF